MKQLLTVWVLAAIGLSGCTSGIKGNEPAKALSISDSMIKAENITDSIRVVAHDSFGVQFIDYNLNSKYHKRLLRYRSSRIDSTNKEEYRQAYESDKLLALRKKYGKAVTDGHLNGDWVPVVKYKGQYYLYMDCEWQSSFAITDSTFVFNNMDGLYPSLLLSADSMGNINIISRQAEEAYTTEKYKLAKVADNPFVYKLQSLDVKECNYFVKASDIHHLPIIAQLCEDESESMVEFDKVNCE